MTVCRPAGLNGMSTSIWEHFPPAQGSPGTPPALLSSGLSAEAGRLKQELEDAHRALKQWGHSWRHTAQVGMSARWSVPVRRPPTWR